MKIRLNKIPFAKIITILVIAVIALPILFCVLWLGAFGDKPKKGVFGKESLGISFENAPAGTLYVDPLIKLDSSDPKYTDFAAVPVIDDRTVESSAQTPVDIGADSEIARLNADGYVSMSLHLKGSKGIKIIKYSSDKTLYYFDWAIDAGGIKYENLRQHRTKT